METRANYVLIGAFTLLGILGGLAFFVWLAQLEVNRQYDYYDVLFDNVSGLSQAGEVRFNGLSVGQVISIDLSEQFRGKVRVRIEVTADTPITEGTQAQLQAQGVTGVSFVGLTGGRPDAPLLRGTNGEIPVIMARPSTLETLTQDAPTLIAEAITLLKSLQSFVSPENQSYVTRILDNLDRASGELQTALNDFSTISRSVATATGEIGNFTGRLDAIGTSVETTLATADQTLEAARGAFAQAETTLGTATGALTSAETAFDGADQVIRDKLPGIVEDLSAAVASLRTAVSEIGTDAASVLDRFGLTADEAKGRLAELKTTIVNLDSALADARVTLSSVDSASQSVEALMAGDGTKLVAEARATLAQASASLRDVDKVMNEDVPGIVAEVRAAVTNANRVIAETGEDVTRFTKGLEPLTATASTTLVTATNTLHDASATLARLDTAMDTAESALTAAQGTFGSAQRVMDEDVGPTAADIRSAAAQLEESIAKVSADVPAITADLRQTVARASEVLARIDGMVAESAGPVRDFTETGLPQFVRFTNEARALVASLEQLTARIERNPAGFFLGNQAPDYRR
jgi:phospholipid/cholesterol/gamma-HCH transport system substrate-binding protein